MPPAPPPVPGQLQQAEQALKRLDVALENIRFDPHSSASIAAAAAQTLGLIDHLLCDFNQHPVLAVLVVKLKTQYLERLQDRQAPPPARPKLAMARPVVNAWNYLKRAV